MNTHEINPDDLAAPGHALYGERCEWQLAHGLSVGDRTLRRWRSRELPVPCDIEYKLYELLEKRIGQVGGLVAFSVRLDVMSLQHNPSGAFFRIEDDDTVTLLQNRELFRGYDLRPIEAGAAAAVLRERAAERHSPVPGEFR